MSSPVVHPIPVDVQRAIIDGSFNSQLLLVLLTGIYSVIYVGSLFVYITRKTGQKRVISAALSIMYGVTIGQLCVQWFYAKSVFVDQGDSRLSIFLATVNNLAQTAFPTAVLQYLGYVLADALLIWRCYHIYGESYRRIICPLVLFSAEIGLSITATIIMARISFQSSYGTFDTFQMFNTLDGVLSVVTATTSLVATVMICRRVWIGTSLNKNSRWRYIRPLQIMVESSMMYSSSVIAIAILDFMPGDILSKAGEIAYIADNYVNAIVSIAAGLAPTLMVARLALTSEPIKESTTIHVPSELRFNDQDTKMSEGSKYESVRGDNILTIGRHSASSDVEKNM